MNGNEASADRAGLVSGRAMLVSWLTGLGIVGFLIFLAVGYAMVAESHVPAVVCSTVLLVPLMSALVLEISRTRRE
jgi:hypothetical protein